MPGPRAALTLLSIAAVAALTANCSSDSLLPTQPPPMSPPTDSPAVVVGLGINGPTRLVPGATARYTATAQYSNGTSADVTTSTS